MSNYDLNQAWSDSWEDYVAFLYRFGTDHGPLPEYRFYWSDMVVLTKEGAVVRIPL